MKNNLRRDYLPSGWIANLGVVPLFLSAAFLLAPEFLFLRALLFFVTLVLETITYTPTWSLKLFNLQDNFLLIRHQSVKVIFICMLLSAAPLLANTDSYENILMGKGEIVELDASRMSHYAVENPEVVTVKFHSSKKSFLLKALRMGSSQVNFWSNSGEKRLSEVFVTSKANKIKLLRLKEYLRKKKIEATFKYGKFYISGKVEQLTDYQKIVKAKQENPKFVELSFELSQKLSFEVIGHIYKNFFDRGFENITCRESFPISCEVEGKSKAIGKLIKELENDYFVQIKRIHKVHATFEVELKIHQIEVLEKTDIDSGMNGLTTNVSELLSKNIITKAMAEGLEFKGNKVKVTTVANPTSIVIENEDLDLKIGTDIPYTGKDSNGNDLISMRFAGLRVKLNMHRRGYRNFLKYKIELSKAGSEKSISKNEKSSTLLFRNDGFQELFHVRYISTSNGKEEVPILGSIPILGSLFSKQIKGQSDKYLIALIKIKELE